MTAPDNANALPAAADAAASAAGLSGLAGHAAALQTVLMDLSTLTVSQLVALFRQYESVPGFEQLLRSALPQIVMPHANAAAAVTAQWYNDIQPGSGFAAAPTVNLPAQRIDKTIGWALNAPGEATPLDRLAGSTKRMVFDASRDTVTANAAQQGIKFARYASANACAFCRVMAARGAVYSSEQSALTVVGRAGRPRGNQPIGEKWHDHCRCMVVPVPAGQTYKPPPYVAQWKQDYKDAWKAVPDGTPYQKVLPSVLAHMRENTDATH